MDGVRVDNISDARSGFQIAGPNAREHLSRVTRADVSAEAFKFMDVKRLTVGMANCIVQRVSYTADKSKVYPLHFFTRGDEYKITDAWALEGTVQGRYFDDEALEDEENKRVQSIWRWVLLP